MHMMLSNSQDSTINDVHLYSKSSSQKLDLQVLG